MLATRPNFQFRLRLRSDQRKTMLTSSGWRYLASASPHFLKSRRSLHHALAVEGTSARFLTTLRSSLPIANPSPCIFFHRLDRNTFSTSSSPPTPTSHPSTKKRGMRETSPLTGDSKSLSPTESSRVTEQTDEELDDALTDDAPVESLTWKERAKNFAVEYGRVGMATHLVLSVLSVSVIYVVISSGVDVSGLLHMLGMSTESDSKDAVATSAGSFMISYAIYKIAAPIRWPITFAVTPVVMRALRRRGYMLPKTKSHVHRSPVPEDEAASHRDRHPRTPKQ